MPKDASGDKKMIKEAYEAGMRQALRDANVVKESSAQKILGMPSLLGAEAGSMLGLISPKTVGHDPLWESPMKRLGKGMGLGALYGGGVGLGAGAASLGVLKLLEKLKPR